MNKVKYGTLRPTFDQAKIGLLTSCAVEYGNMGYADDLQYYQGEDSIFKAERLAQKLPKEQAEELISLVRDSNERMERAANN